MGFIDFIRVLRRKAKYYRLRKKGVIIGQDTWVLNRVSNFGSEPYLIHIGNHCAIAAGVEFITHDGGTRVFRDDPGYSNVNKYGKIVLEDNVTIGVQAIIMPGVTIGSNSVVGAGSVVRKSIPPNVVVAGNPARVVCKLEEYIKICQEETIPFPEHYTSKRKVLEEYFWGNEANNNKIGV